MSVEAQKNSTNLAGLKFVYGHRIILSAPSEDTGGELRLVGGIRIILRLQTQTHARPVLCSVLSLLGRDEITCIELNTGQCGICLHDPAVLR